MMSEQQDVRKIIKQTGIKDRLTSFEIVVMQEDFYKISKDYINALEGEEKQQMLSEINRLIMSRKSKVIRLAEAGNEDPEVLKKMTPEERKLYDSVLTAKNEFEGSVQI